MERKGERTSASDGGSGKNKEESNHVGMLSREKGVSCCGSVAFETEPGSCHAEGDGGRCGTGVGWGARRGGAGAVIGSDEDDDGCDCDGSEGGVQPSLSPGGVGKSPGGPEEDDEGAAMEPEAACCCRPMPLGTALGAAGTDEGKARA